jgi:hypothetical protein
MQLPFTPSGTVSLSVTGTTGSVRLSSPNPVSVRIYNAGSATIFFKAGPASVEATTSDTPIPSGAIEVFNLTPMVDTAGGCSHIAAITASSTATAYFTVGSGI